jgi:exodeoxyribonuclease VIII
MSNQRHGFYKDMPNDDYHASEGISKSGLDKINRSPAHYKYPKKSKSTRNMEIGTAIHAAILEPERFDKEYCVVSCDSRQKKEYKEQAAKFTGEMTLTKPESVNVLGMRESVESNLDAMKLLRIEGDAELSAFATDPETGIQIRARYDWITKDGIVVDVKKTQDLRKFAKSVAEYRYHVQEAFYRHVYRLITGEELKAFYFLAVEEESPHSNELFLLDDLSREIGEHYYRKDLRTYARCVENNYWPHGEFETVLELPNWEVSKYESDLEVFI